MTPIIIPVNTNSTRDCIIQGGVRYCEKGNTSPQELGILLLGIFAFFCWCMFVFWFAFKYEDRLNVDAGVVIICGCIGLPLLLGGIALLLV